jgi:CheY-like chemotaxis protein
VDDDSELLALSEKLLHKTDSRLVVETMVDPLDAVEAIRGGSYDAIISAYEMPELNGLELLTETRQQGHDIPFVLFTGEDAEIVAREALTRGADRYIQKDGDPETQYVVLAHAVVDEIEHARTKATLQEHVTAAEASDDSIYMLDPDGVYVFANAEHLSRLVSDGKISTADERQISGCAYGSIHPDRDADRLTEFIQTAIESGEAVTEEYSYETEDNWSYRTYSPVFDRETDNSRGVVVISKDITERKQMENREALLHSLLRHDVKNKIHAADGYLDLVETTELPDDTVGWLSTTSRLLDDSISLIDNVGTLAELTQDDPEPWELGEVIEKVLDGYRPQAETADIDISAEDCSCRVLGGPLLEPLFGNLVSNALTHANADCIEIRCRRDGDEYVVSVVDDGAGLATDSGADLLEKGVSEGDSAGTGLGLYLVSEIVDSYGGHLSLDSSPSGGLAVTARLQAA